MRFAFLLLLLSACAPMLPLARPVTAPTGAREVEADAWRRIGGVGPAPLVTYVRSDCDDGLQSYSGQGCVRGLVVAGRVYVAAIGAWRQVVAHELLHVALGGDDAHESPRWVKCGDHLCAREVASAAEISQRERR